MSNAARVTGKVLNVTTRSGTSAATGNPWSMTTARVLVANEDICDVGIPDSYVTTTGHQVAQGDDVDLFVSVRASKGFLNIDAVKPWPGGARSLAPAPAVVKSS